MNLHLIVLLIHTIAITVLQGVTIHDYLSPDDDSKKVAITEILAITT